MEYSQRLEKELLEAQKALELAEKELQDTVNLAQSHLAEAEQAQDELTRVQGSYEALKQKLQGDRRFTAACHALQGLLAGWDSSSQKADPDMESLADEAVVAADALLTALER